VISLKSQKIVFLFFELSHNEYICKILNCMSKTRGVAKRASVYCAARKNRQFTFLPWHGLLVDRQSVIAENSLYFESIEME